MTASAAELAERLTIAQQANGFQFELRGQGDDGAAGLVKRAELQRMLQMLQAEIAKAGWIAAPAQAASGGNTGSNRPKAGTPLTIAPRSGVAPGWRSRRMALTPNAIGTLADMS